MASRLFTPGLSAVLLLIVTALLYSRTLSYPLVYEDLNDTSRAAHTVLTGPVLNPARLLTMITIEGADALTPGSALGNHAINVLWHLVNVGLVLALAWLWLPPWGAVLAAGLFALHPLQVETVAYVASRSELVAVSGVVLALLAASLGSLTGAVVGVVFACLGKESAIMAWGLVPLWALSTRTTFPVRKFLLIGIALAAVGVWVFLGRVGHLSAGLDLERLGRTATALMGLTARVFAPVGLSIDHDWRGVALMWQSLAVGGVVALTCAAIWTLQLRRSWFALAWLSTLLLMVPRFLMSTSEGLHEHHMAVPLVFWSLAIGAWLSRSPKYQELT